MNLAMLEKHARILAEKKEKKKAKQSKKEQDGDSSEKKSSKRKLEDSGDDSTDKENKKQHLAAASKYPSPPPTHAQSPAMSSTHSLTAAVQAKVAEQMAANASRQKTSSAIKSLYNNGRSSRPENFMNR